MYFGLEVDRPINGGGEGGGGRGVVIGSLRYSQASYNKVNNTF